MMLKHIIESVLERIPQSRFIISGDFNEKRKEITAYVASKGLRQALQEGTTTHN